MDEWIRNMVYIYNGKLFSHKKGNFAICDHMDGYWGHYAKWSKLNRKTNTVWSHVWNLRAKNKKSELIGTECKSEGLGVGKMGKGGKKIQNSSYKINKSEELRWWRSRRTWNSSLSTDASEVSIDATILTGHWLKTSRRSWTPERTINIPA